MTSVNASGSPWWWQLKLEDLVPDRANVLTSKPVSLGDPCFLRFFCVVSTALAPTLVSVWSKIETNGSMAFPLPPEKASGQLNCWYS